MRGFFRAMEANEPPLLPSTSKASLEAAWVNAISSFLCQDFPVRRDCVIHLTYITAKYREQDLSFSVKRKKCSSILRNGRNSKRNLGNFQDVQSILILLNFKNTQIRNRERED